MRRFVVVAGIVVVVCGGVVVVAGVAGVVGKRSVQISFLDFAVSQWQ